jgi:hypothetical protein
MHSLAVIGADRMNQTGFYTTEDEDGIKKIPAESGEYGWGYETLKTPIEKLSYVTTMIQYKDYVDEIPDSEFFKWLSEMVKDYTGYELIYVPNSNDGFYKDGYIDHQSTDTLDSEWAWEEEKFKSNMRDIIFNDKYFIIIDNDN